jgi:hypothetical protein
MNSMRNEDFGVQAGVDSKVEAPSTFRRTTEYRFGGARRPHDDSGLGCGEKVVPCAAKAVVGKDSVVDVWRQDEESVHSEPKCFLEEAKD